MSVSSFRLELAPRGSGCSWSLWYRRHQYAGGVKPHIFEAVARAHYVARVFNMLARPLRVVVVL